jgi:hypothetical protein
LLKGVGTQAVGWSAINMGLALLGERGTARRAAQPGAMAAFIQAREAANLRNLLWFNAGLDVLYMIGGLAWARRARTAFGRGSGLGIVLQGLTLLTFDVVQAREVPTISADAETA